MVHHEWVMKVSNLIEKMYLAVARKQHNANTVHQHAAPTLLKEKGYSRSTDKHRPRCLTSSTLDKLSVDSRSRSHRSKNHSRLIQEAGNPVRSQGKEGKEERSRGKEGTSSQWRRLDSPPSSGMNVTAFNPGFSAENPDHSKVSLPQNKRSASTFTPSWQLLSYRPSYGTTQGWDHFFVIMDDIIVKHERCHIHDL